MISPEHSCRTFENHKIASHFFISALGLVLKTKVPGQTDYFSNLTSDSAPILDLTLSDKIQASHTIYTDFSVANCPMNIVQQYAHIASQIVAVHDSIHSALQTRSATATVQEPTTQQTCSELQDKNARFVC